MAPIIDAVIIGFVITSVAWLARRRHPARALKRSRERLRARCIRYLEANPRSRREFARIIREAVRIADEERVEAAVAAVRAAAREGRAEGVTVCGVSGVVKVAQITGVPIQLVFDWQDGAFSYPPQEVYLRAGAVASIWDALGPSKEAPPLGSNRRGGFIPAGEVAKAIAAVEKAKGDLAGAARLAVAEAAGRDLSAAELFDHAKTTVRSRGGSENARNESPRGEKGAA